MLIELLLAYLVLHAPPAPQEPIVIPVAAEDLARCQMTIAQVLAGPMVDELPPSLALAKQPAREVLCIVEETAD